MTDRIVQLEALLNADPDDAFCLYGLAMEYARDSRHDEALELFDRNITVAPDTCYAYYHKARVQQALGDDEDAATTLTTGLERARACGDSHAAGEIEAFLEELE